jgi:hypothetical protein
MISRLPLPRLVWETRMTSRAALASPGGGSRSVLRVTLAMRSDAADAPRNSRGPFRHGGEIGLAVECRETAPPIRAAPHRPVRMVPLNHCTETRRRSITAASEPSTESGGS